MSISQASGITNAYQNTTSLTATQDDTLLKTQPKDAAKVADKAVENPAEKVVVNQTTIRNERQASLVAHLFGDTDQNAEKGMKMTFQAAIEALNTQFKAELGDAYEEFAITQGNFDKKGAEYWNPENTSERILAGATSFLAGFQKQHPKLEGEELMNKFMEVVGGGLQKGFDEAQGILTNLKVFDGTVKETFTATVDLVNKGMENFKKQFLDNAAGTTTPPKNEGANTIPPKVAATEEPTKTDDVI